MSEATKPRRTLSIIQFTQLNTNIIVLVASILFLVGCGGGSSPMTTNPVPTVSGTSPGAVLAGGTASFTLTAIGTGFVSESVVNINGTARATTFVSASQLTVTIAPSDTQGKASLVVSVTNPPPGGGMSNSVSCDILVVESIHVFPTSPSVSVGATQQFTAQGLIRGVGTQDLTNAVTWSSSNTALATISSSGLATGVAIGRPKISATLGIAVGSAPLIVLSAGNFNVPRFAYAADIVDNTVSLYTVNSATGQLRHNGYALAGGNPTSVAVDPASRFAYASNSSSNTISAYSVDPARGTLTEISGSPFATGSNPNSVAVDPSGTFVYTANEGGTVSAFSIDSTSGALVAITGSPFPAGTQPVSVTVDPSGRFAYVTNASSSNVSAYSIDAATGALASISGSPFAVGMLPFSMEVDPSGKFAYVANSQSNSISAFAIDPTSGILTSVAGSPFAAGSTPNSLTVDPSSKFVYVTNSASNNVSAYTIGSTGALTPVPQSPFTTGSNPNSVKVDPSGKFAYVVNLGTASESVSEYAINPATGALTSVGEVRTRGQAVSIALSRSTTAVAYTPKFAYVANNVSNDVSGFSINPNTGVLTPVSGSPFPSGMAPFGVTIAPAGKFAFVTNGGNGTVSAYLIDPNSGALTSVTGSPFAMQGASQLGTPAVDSSGRFLYVPTYTSRQVFGYSIDQTKGSLTPIPGSPFPAPNEAFNAAVDPTGRFLYVACQGAGTGVSAYTIDVTTGALSPITGSPFPAGPEASGIVVDPSGRFVYVSNQSMDTTYQFSINPVFGSLTQIGATPALSGVGVAIAVEPTGKYAYITDGLGFAIDSTAGTLSQISGPPFVTGSIPFSITVDPSGKFVYVANQGGGVSAYTIDLTTGSLASVAGSPFGAGTAPTSVATTGSIQ